MNALFKYPGSKWSISDWIIAHFPEHKVYCEPFFGSGAVFFSKCPSYIETINDINGDIVNLFAVCRDHAEELAAAIELTPYARDEFNFCVDNLSKDPLERARRTIVRFQQCYGMSQRTSKHSWRNCQVGSGPRCALQFAQLPAAILQIAARLREAQIENVDALTLIERYNDPNTLIYCDPPYLKDIRKNNLYEHEMSNSAHIELLQKLKASNSKVILSAYDSELYNNVLSDWYTDTRITQAHNNEKRTEKLYMNFQPPLLYFS